MCNPINEFKKYALWYFNDWVWFDKDFCLKMSGPNLVGALQNAAAYYNVSRNFKGIRGKLNEMTAAIEKIPAPLNDSDIDESVKKLSIALAKIDGRGGGNRISAASKFLWLRFKAPIVIFDSRAVTSLKRLGGIFKNSNYVDYRRTWNVHFEKKAETIKISCCAIQQCLKEQFNQETAVLSERWFFERVFDKYLWHLGKMKPKREESLPSQHRGNRSA